MLADCILSVQIISLCRLMFAVTILPTLHASQKLIWQTSPFGNYARMCEVVIVCTGSQGELPGGQLQSEPFNRIMYTQCIALWRVVACAFAQNLKPCTTTA